jgi:hypothetical protein
MRRRQRATTRWAGPSAVSALNEKRLGNQPAPYRTRSILETAGVTRWLYEADVDPRFGHTGSRCCYCAMSGSFPERSKRTTRWLTESLRTFENPKMTCVTGWLLRGGRSRRPRARRVGGQRALMVSRFAVPRSRSSLPQWSVGNLSGVAHGNLVTLKQGVTKTGQRPRRVGTRWSSIVTSVSGCQPDCNRDGRIDSSIHPLVRIRPSRLRPGCR